MKWKFHPEAAEEYLAASRYYGEIEGKLGLSFVLAVEAGLGQIASHPWAGRQVDADIRRHLLSRFPYGIYYTIEEDFILVVAILHLKREPGFWRSRLPLDLG